MRYLSDDELRAFKSAAVLGVYAFADTYPARLQAFVDGLLERAEARRRRQPEPDPEIPEPLPTGDLDAAALAAALERVPPHERPGVIALARMLGLTIPQASPGG
jgi:hypothetical protein